MEGRKLQLTGGSTYVVSLPKHWVVDSGLKAGDTVFLETEPQGSVMIRPRPTERAHLRRRISEEKCLRRMHLTVRAMHEDAIAALRTRDDALARDVAQRDQDVDRLYWMVAKQYNIAHTGGGGMAPDVASKIALHNYRLIAKLFERIGDHAERIARTYPVFAEGRLEPKLLKEMDVVREFVITILEKVLIALMPAVIDAANSAVDVLSKHQ